MKSLHPKLALLSKKKISKNKNKNFTYWSMLSVSMIDLDMYRHQMDSFLWIQPRIRKRSAFVYKF